MKGVDGITIGLIIGINELVCVLSSPILGANVSKPALLRFSMVNFLCDRFGSDDEIKSPI